MARRRASREFRRWRIRCPEQQTLDQAIAHRDNARRCALNSGSALRPYSTWRASQHPMVYGLGVGNAQGLAVVRFGENHNMQYGGQR